MQINDRICRQRFKKCESVVGSVDKEIKMDKSKRIQGLGGGEGKTMGEMAG